MPQDFTFASEHAAQLKLPATHINANRGIAVDKSPFNRNLNNYLFRLVLAGSQDRDRRGPRGALVLAESLAKLAG